MNLTPKEIRTLGCLLEKAHTTPDTYPLTTNSLLSACNQTTNRNPVVTYTQKTVDETVKNLRETGLVRTIRAAGMRSHKHKHTVEEKLGLSQKQQAILAVLLLRGAQSIGELKTRTERYTTFRDLEEIEQTLQKLATRDTGQLVQNKGREPGQAQDRWIHLLGETIAQEIDDTETTRTENTELSQGEPTNSQLKTTEKIKKLEGRILALEKRIVLLEAPNQLQ